jgi:branched-chain amino acid aminotransferase
VPLFGALSHASWMGSVVFDGARAFEGCAPDLDRHCERAVASARHLGLCPTVSPGEVHEIALEGIRRFASGTALYLRPLFFGDEGLTAIEPEGTRFALTAWECPLPAPTGFSACCSPFRRPAPEAAPTEAKASCLYPNSLRAVTAAKTRGFDTAVLLDPAGHVAEFALANLFLVRNGAVHTPVPNGTFLNGITRQRVIGLLRRAGVPVHERLIAFEELLEADEVFSTGNYGKVLPATRIENRALEPGPVYARARQLYWEFAHRAGLGRSSTVGRASAVA